MQNQNINPQKKEAGLPTDENRSNLDKWNDRLDNNLEPETEGDAEADENATDYSEDQGSGNQSDEE